MRAPAVRRTKPRAETAAVVGEGRDLDALASIAWAGVLSTSQVERLHFPSRRRAQRRLRALLDHGLVRAHLQGEALQRENLFTPTELGLERLADRGFFDGLPPRLMRMPRAQHLAHALAVREVFVAAVLAERDARFRIDAFRYEHELREELVLAAAGLHPDALVSLTRDGVERLVGVEADRATETRATLRAKFDVWRRVLTTAGARLRFETALLLVTTPRETRAATLRALAHEAGLSGRVKVIPLAELAATFASGWPFAVAAPPGRANAPHTWAETTSAAVSDDGFTPITGRRAT